MTKFASNVRLVILLALLLIFLVLTGCASITVDNWRPTLRLDNGDWVTVKKQRGGALVIWWQKM